MENVKLFVTNVDGTLTGGGMCYSGVGDDRKKFNTHDSMRLQLLHSTGVKTATITTEDTKLVEHRASKLKVYYLIQGQCDGMKLVSILRFCKKIGITIDEVAYIGDVNCLDLFSNVGVKFCVSNICEEMMGVFGIIVMNKKGGEGCLR